MKKLLYILLIGVLLSLVLPNLAQAQRIKKGPDGILYASTDYNYDKNKSDNKKIVKGLIFIAACSVILSTEYALFPSERDNVNHLYRQMGYAGVAVVGACVTVTLYSWNVKLQDKIGL